MRTMAKLARVAFYTALVGLLVCALALRQANAGGFDPLLRGRVLAILAERFGAAIAVSGTPTDGHVLTYDSTAGAWGAEAAASSGQPEDDDLTEIAALTRTRGDLIVGGAAAWEDLAIGGADSVLRSDGTDASWGTVAVAGGGTGATTAAGARSALGVQNVWLSWVAGQGIHPSSNSAGLSVRGSTLHGTYTFDQTTAESIIYEGHMPSSYDSSGSLTVSVWFTSTATSGTVVFSAEVEHIEEDTLDIDSDSFDTAKNSSSTGTSGTSGIASRFDITLTNAEADAVVAGKPFRLRLARVPGDAGDNMAADAEVLRVVVRQ